MKAYIPHTQEDRQAMLDAIGVKTTDELFSAVPDSVSLYDSVPIAKGLSEEEVIRRLKSLANRNIRGISFLGAGCYEHIIPSVVKSITALPSFVTAYTPYQPEISQGVLQSIYEYQTMICELTGMDVSNASLYDVSSAAAEAASVGIASRRKSNEIIISSTMHPFAKSCVKTWAEGRGHIVTEIPEKNGETDFVKLEKALNDSTAVVIVQSPNVYGVLEDFTGLADKVHSAGALLCISSDPLSLGMQKSQGEWGADIAIGDTQVLGIPMAFGGPYCGYMAVKNALMRKIPGRIVGKTLDSRGQTAYVLTLQAREQHIKRERATSNICSNEALMALTSAVYLSTLGWNGVLEASEQCYAKSHYLAYQISLLPGVCIKYSDKPFWCEFALEFRDEKKLRKLIAELKSENIFGGVKLSNITRNKQDDNILLVAVTEKRTREEIEQYIAAARKVLL